MATFLKSQVERQVFKKTQDHKDQRNFASTTAREKWYADLIDFSARPDGDFKYIFVAIDNYTKRVFLENF